MAIPLKPTDIADLSTLTYNTMVKDKTWNDISNTIQTHSISSRFFKGKKQDVKSGPQLTWKLQVANSDSWTYTGLYDEDRYDVRDGAISATQDWAMVTANMSWDARESDFQSDSRTQLVDALLLRRNMMFNNWFNSMEAAFWSAPTAPPSAPGEVFQLCGVPFWVVKSATLGFNGGNPSGFTSGAGGVSSSAYTTWANYTGTFSQVVPDDLIAKVDTAMVLCNFVSPHEFPTTSDGPPQYVMYTTLPNITKLKKYLKARQDNIGNDVGLGNSVMWNSMPVTRVAALDTSSFSTYDSTNPFYGINWNALKLYFCNGKDMKRTDPYFLTNAHNMWVEPYDSTLQMACVDRRTNFVFYQV